MKNSIIEVVKNNKGKIIKRALIVGGTIVGLVVVGRLFSPNVKHLIEGENILEVLEDSMVEVAETITE